MSVRWQLALDASAGPASVALFRDAACVASRRLERAGSAERLAPAIAELLASQQLAARAVSDIIVGAGPGSFTGLRVAAALGKGLAHGAGASLHAVSSLGLIAAADATRAPGVYCAVLDALRGEWFAQRVTRLASGAWCIEGPVTRASSATIRGHAAADGVTLLGPPIDAAQQPDASAALELAPITVNIAAWEPDYGRLAEAQVQWEATHQQPLPSR
jgi:tRNA threonylcarbamoyladenosine biosynthesis protein TsaB